MFRPYDGLAMGTIRLETFVAAPIERVFDLARDIDFHQWSVAHTGERAIAGRRSGPIGLGETVTWRARHFLIFWSLTSQVTAFDRPDSFVDEQLNGPFRYFRHEHRFEALAGGTKMTDKWRHRSPLGPLGRLVDRLVLDRYMRRLLETRNASLKREAERTR
jgi:ligand-binding SRPBCC domain-containing protein